MYIADLSTNAYFATGDVLRAVGWLEADETYQQGAVPAGFLDQLKHHISAAYQPMILMGVHFCSLCPQGQRKHGNDNLLVPTETLLYVAPAMIGHYIEDHGYRPPQEFVEALMACPQQNSSGYLALLRPYERYWTQRA